MELNDIFAQGISAPKRERPIRIRVVANEYCPSCGSEGRPKVADRQNNWWWRCYTPYDRCRIGYYLPGTTRTEAKLSPAEDAAESARIRAQLKEQMKDRIWISRGNTSTTIHRDEAIPEGWHLTGTHKDD